MAVEDTKNNEGGQFFSERTMSLIAQKLKHEIPVEPDVKEKYEAQLRSMQEGRIVEAVTNKETVPEPEVTEADVAEMKKDLGEAGTLGVETKNKTEREWSSKDIAGDILLATTRIKEAERDGQGELRTEAINRLRDERVNMNYLFGNDLNRDTQKKERSKRRSELRKLATDLKNGEISEEQKSVLEDNLRIKMPEGVQVVVVGESLGENVAEIEAKPVLKDDEDLGLDNDEIKEFKLRKSVAKKLEIIDGYDNPKLRSRLTAKLAEQLASQGAPADLVNSLTRKSDADSPIERGKILEIENDDQGELVRGILIEKVSGASLGSNVDVIFNLVQNDYRTLKGLTQFGVFSPEKAVEIKTEIAARLNLHQVEMAWNDIKNDFQTEADAYASMKSRLKGMPVLAESTYKWLFQGLNTDGTLKAECPNANFRSPMDREKRVVSENLSSDVSRALNSLYAEMMRIGPDGKPAGIDFWTVVTDDDKSRLFEKVGISNENVGLLAFQIMEAELWGADRVKTAHPARRLIAFSKFRKEKFESSGAAPGGERLIQEYLDIHPNVLAKDVPADIFDPEQKKWARNGLDMVYGYDETEKKTNLSRLPYLGELMLKKNRDQNITQEVMRTELSKAASIFDAFEPIGKPPVEVGALQKLKVAIFIWHTFEESIGMAGSGESSSSMVSGGRGESMMSFATRLTKEYSKTAVWANSIANTRNAKPMAMHELYNYFDAVVKAYDPMKDSPGVIGLDKIDKRRQVSDIAAWFGNLWYNKCYFMMDNDRAPFMGKWKLPQHLRRSDLLQASFQKIKKDGDSQRNGYKPEQFVNDRNGWWNN